MRFRSLTLLTAFLMLVSLSGCGTDTKTSSELSSTSDVSVITRAVEASKHNALVGDAVNSCTNCHAGSGAIYKHVAVLNASAEYETCGTACHTADPPLSGVTMKVISDTHSDDKSTANIIEGYVVRATADSACRDCHAAHTTDLTIQKEWAESGHAGEIANGPVKDDISVTPSINSAWAHYDWDAGNRSACQRCHTATGAANFLNNPTEYNAVNNDFSHLADWSATSKTSGQNELLYCWGCHSDTEKGELRDPGALNFTVSNGATVSFPDASHSNLCIACHAGRETGDSIKKSAADFSNTGFINSHYLAAAGILYGKSGYEFASKDYRSSLGFRHDMTGENAPLPTKVTEKGPCVYCHMGSFTNHSWKISSDESCDLCHAGTAFSLVEEAAVGFDDALEVLKAVLETNGFYFYAAHPYFYTKSFVPSYEEVGECAENLPVKNWQEGGASIFEWKLATATSTTKSCVSSPSLAGAAYTGLDRMGAAYNYNLLIHEPGAFVHNSLYAKRLIFDSVDWLDNAIMDGQVTIDADIYPEAAVWFGAPTQVTGPFVASRP